MHDKYGLLQDRLKRVLLEKIIPAIQTCITPLGLAAWHVEGGQGEPVAPSVALALTSTSRSAPVTKHTATPRSNPPRDPSRS